MRRTQDHELVLPRGRVDALHLIDDYRRRIVFTEFKPARYHRRKIVLQQRRVLAINLGPSDAFGATRLIFQSQQGKLVALLCGPQLHVGDDTSAGDSSSARHVGQLRRRNRFQTLQRLEVALEWMAGDVKPKRRFLRVQHFHLCPALQRWRDLVSVVNLFRHRAKQSVLTLKAIPFRALRPRQRRIDGTVQAATPIMGRAAVLQGVKGACAYQTLEHSLVQGSRVDPFSEIEEGPEWSSLAGLTNSFNRRLTQSLNRGQTIPDCSA